MRMSDEEVMIYLRGDGMLNKVRAAFSSECGRMEQDEQQRTKPTPVERRRMEFEAARHIAEVLGVTL